MKSFFKYLLATIVGILISTILIIVLGFAIISAISSSKDKPLEINNNSILYLDLNVPIIDRKPSSPFDFRRFSHDSRIGLNEILRNIEKAKQDDKIKGIYLELGYGTAGIGTTEEIRNALIDFKSSGKFIVSYSNDLFTQKAFYLASVSDKIFLNPAGMVLFNGLSIRTVHFKNILEKLDIDVEVSKIGEYKSAPEMYENDKMSKYSREQSERLINTIWDKIALSISESRNIPVDTLNELANNLGVNDPSVALKYNFVDSLIYKGDVINYLKNITHTSDKNDLESVTISEYDKVPAHKNYKGLARDKIAVIYASGTIIGGEGDENNIGGQRFARAIRKARRDSGIKAIVLRVNSPGGSAMASEDIWAEIRATKGVKPIIVSMGDVAASGGYYISCLADTILVNNTTITGSIGVYSNFINTQHFFNKLGVTFDFASTHDNGPLLSGLKPITEDERALIKHFTETTYDTFITHVADGRNLTKERVNEIARGHVYSGIDAITINLADGIGGLKDAISIAHDKAGLGDKYRIVELPKQPDPFEQIVQELTGEARIKTTFKTLGIDEQSFYEIRDLFKTQGIITRLPYNIDIQ